jgi:hypothetical protein
MCSLLMHRKRRQAEVADLRAELMQREADTGAAEALKVGDHYSPFLGLSFVSKSGGACACG